MTVCLSRPTEPTWRQFRTQVWYSYICAHASRNEIDSKLRSSLEESSKLQFKWASGTACTRSSAEKYSNIRGSLELFDLEVFPLLDHRRIPVELPKFFREHIIDLPYGRFWHFDCDVRYSREMNRRTMPHPSYKREFHRYLGDKLLAESIPKIDRQDSQSLASRGDLKGFTAILAMVRDAERKNDEIDHPRHVANLYRMLPTIIQTTPFGPHYHQLANFIRRIQQRLPNSRYRVDVNWSLIEEQIEQGVAIPQWDQLERLEQMRVPPEIMRCARTYYLK